MAKNIEALKIVILFSQLSEIIRDDRKLLRYFNVKNTSRWNNLMACECRKNSIAALKKLACQQQKLLKFEGIGIEDLSFEAVKGMDIVRDASMIQIYAQSSYLYNSRNFESQGLKVIDLQEAALYMKSMGSIIAAVNQPEDIEQISIMPSMKTAKFWGRVGEITVGNIQYYRNTGFNAKLAQAIKNPEKILVACY